MYDRAPRTFQQTVGSTSAHVGPGTYDHGRKNICEGNYAPFLSLSTRSELFVHDANPGPGHYDIRSSSLTGIKGGCAPSNRATRFEEDHSKITPGPGAYELQRSPLVRSFVIEPTKYSRQTQSFSNRRLLPPSIPDPKSANGFEENELGLLVPQQAPAYDTTLGPAFYQTSTPIENDRGKSYRGVHFSKYSSKRTEFMGKSGPGPGDYDPNDSFKLELQHMNLKLNEKRPDLQVARYPDILLKAVTKDNIPGPGRYSIKRELDPVRSKSELKGIDGSKAPFGSYSKRFESPLLDIPGPGTYDDKVSTAFNNVQSRITSVQRTPFNQTTPRFSSPTHKSRNQPGPAQYHLPGFAEENLRRSFIENGRKAPFNVTSVRRMPLIRSETIDAPGPSSYDVKTEPNKNKHEQPSSNFISNTSRELVIEDFPGPTAYEVSRAFEALTTQRRKPPRSKQAFRRQSQFLTASKRTYAGEVNSETPGPGAYDTLISSRAHGFAPLHETRFQRDESQGPGPTTYELSPLLEDTVLRGTFNSTLNNPILAKYFERMEKEEKTTNGTTKIQMIAAQ